MKYYFVKRHNGNQQSIIVHKCNHTGLMVGLVVGSGGSVGAGGHEVPFIPVIPVGPVPVNPDTLAPDPVGFVPV